MPCRDNGKVILCVEVQRIGHRDDQVLEIVVLEADRNDVVFLRDILGDEIDGAFVEL